MTAIFWDGFDVGNHIAKYSAVVGAQIGAARTGAFAWGASGSNPHSVVRDIATADKDATMFVALAGKHDASTTRYIYVRFMADAGVTTHIEVRFIPDTRRVEVYRGAGTTLLGQSADNVLAVNGSFWQAVIKVVLHDTTGSVEVRLDGQPTSVVNLTAQDTKNAGTETVFSRITWGGSREGTRYDDVAVFNSAGGQTWPGDCKVEMIVPSGAGNTTGLTPSTGANYAAVDETGTPNTTDYVSSAVDNTYDTYAMGDLVSGAGSIIHGVWASYYAQKSDAGAKSLASVLRSAGTDYTSTDQALPAGWTYLNWIYLVDPATSAAWAVAAVNALEAGPKVRP